jgi:hypothetical protein
MNKKSKNNGVAHLVGIGLDNEDGHKRITKAEEFSVVGGSDETHGRLTETLVKTFEQLGAKGKTLQSVSREELSEIVNRSIPN